MKYVVVAPRGEITIGLSYGSVTYTNGQVIDENDACKLFPSHFIPVPDDFGKPKEKFVKTDSNEKIEIKETKAIETPKPTEKRKAGRPKKNIIKKG